MCLAAYVKRLNEQDLGGFHGRFDRSASLQ